MSRSTIRFYVQSGLLTPTTSSNGYQHFSQADLIAANFMVVSRFVGYSLARTVNILKAQRAGLITVEQRIAGQRAHIAAIDKKVRQLLQVRYIWAKRLEHYESGSPGEDPGLAAFEEARKIGINGNQCGVPDDACEGIDLAIRSLKYIFEAHRDEMAKTLDDHGDQRSRAESAAKRRSPTRK